MNIHGWCLLSCVEAFQEDLSSRMHRVFTPSVLSGVILTLPDKDFHVSWWIYSRLCFSPTLLLLINGRCENTRREGGQNLLNQSVRPLPQKNTHTPLLWMF